MKSSDSNCATCASNVIPFISSFFSSPPTSPQPSSFLSASFPDPTSTGLSTVSYIYPTAGRYYTQPNCIASAFASGLRGAAVGSVYGGAMALSTAVQSGYRGSSVITYAGQGALRNAVAFGSWTSTYAFTKCGLVRIRGTHDMLNSLLAGGFTGGFLTVVANRGVWRYQRQVVFTNAAASAMIALIFDAINRM